MTPMRSSGDDAEADEARGGTAAQVIRALLKQTRCTDCDCAYRAEDVHVLRQEDDQVWDLAVVCHRCYTMSLVRAIIQIPASRLSQLASQPARLVPTHELTPMERAHFRALDPVDMDDVLDLTGFLANFDGDFQSLFQHGGGDP